MKNSQEVNEELGKRVKRVRERFDIKQHELASILNYSPNYISMVERGERSLSRASVETIARQFGVRIAFLLGADDFMTEEDFTAANEKTIIMLEDGFDDFVSYIAERIGYNTSPRKTVLDPVEFTDSDFIKTQLSSDEIDKLQREIIEFAEFKLGKAISKQKSKDNLIAAIDKAIKSEED